MSKPCCNLSGLHLLFIEEGGVNDDVLLELLKIMMIINQQFLQEH